MARHHIEEMFESPGTEVVAICEPSAPAYAAVAELFDQHGLPVPPNEPDWKRFVARYAGELDAVVIITPHALHFGQAMACLEAGFDVLLEKPMVMTAEEARALIDTRDRTGRLLVVAFQGSLSPYVREAARMIRSGELGPILNINAVVWQDWATLTDGTWRQEPAMSGGGFLFDTGAHMLNTVADLAGEDFADVAAWLEDDGRPVDVRAVVMGRLASGALVTMNAVRQRDPVLPFGHSRVHEQGDPADGDLGRDARVAARRPGTAAQGPVGRADAGLGSVPECSCRADPQPEPARGRPADGAPVGRDPRIDRARWRRRQAATDADPDAPIPTAPDAPTAVAAQADRPSRRTWPSLRVDDPGHRLERVPPRALRPRRRRDLPGRHPRRGR